MNLKVTIDGLQLDNPLMPASGPIVGDDEKLLFLQGEGVGALVTKTISTKEPQIPRPCIYGDRTFVMNSELWSEHAASTWIESFLPNLVKQKTRPLIISVGYTKEDMEYLIPKLDPFADAFEVSTHYVGKNLDVIADTVRTIRSHTEKPIYMKISPHIPDPVAFAKAVQAAGASGLVAINSLGPTMKINAKTRQIEYAPESGFVWMSGPAIKHLAQATVYTIKQVMPDFTVIGVGGIASAEDVIEFMLAGADAVQMLSGALIKGKQLYKKIINDLPKVLKKYGYTSIEDVQQTVLKNPVTYEPRIPELDVEKCTECMLCEKICPYFAITMEDIITINPEKCFGCGLCISKCPTHALK
ncbi:4Fe-4S binding protein [Candidatus Xianfuyuplasma coldseepsis]|uniref:Dihydrothymine dehydrogenase n=1 Tax=Candidatus Xianfuyuplasma coldseepsis TaxID=2782163 RepID=A0A7L7KR26_9MOLU|nr:4Fe-4S binding protein [Xianfuyuplasma coldseepsis]QMS84404.1 4Fe-4S dicluster domain-containing protein [Xianfuyuplasma coldseepsis]